MFDVPERGRAVDREVGKPRVAASRSGKRARVVRVTRSFETIRAIGLTRLARRSYDRRMNDARRQDLRRACRGDRDALSRLLARSERRLTGLARARLGDELRQKVRTSDILQSTYLDVVRSVGDFGGETEDEFVTWVGRIMENTIRDKRRYFAATKRQEPGGDTRIGPDRAEGALHSPSSVAAWGDDIGFLRAALARLSDDHREVIVRRMVKNESYADVAAALGRSELATRALLHRARGALLMELDRLRSG